MSGTSKPANVQHTYLFSANLHTSGIRIGTRSRTYHQYYFLKLYEMADYIYLLRAKIFDELEAQYHL